MTASSPELAESKALSMKNWRKKIVFLLVAAIFLSFSLTAIAEEQKGFLIRIWEDIRSRLERARRIAPVEKKKVKPPTVEKKEKIELPVVEEKIEFPIDEEVVEPPIKKKVEPPVEEKKVEPPVEKEKVPERVEKPKRERKMIPKEIMIDTMKRRLRVFPSIADMIPSLSRAGTTSFAESMLSFPL